MKGWRARWWKRRMQNLPVPVGTWEIQLLVEEFTLKLSGDWQYGRKGACSRIRWEGRGNSRVGTCGPGRVSEANRGYTSGESPGEWVTQGTSRLPGPGAHPREDRPRGQQEGWWDQREAFGKLGLHSWGGPGHQPAPEAEMVDWDGTLRPPSLPQPETGGRLSGWHHHTALHWAGATGAQGGGSAERPHVTQAWRDLWAGQEQPSLLLPQAVRWKQPGPLTQPDCYRPPPTRAKGPHQPCFSGTASPQGEGAGAGMGGRTH